MNENEFFDENDTSSDSSAIGSDSFLDSEYVGNEETGQNELEGGSQNDYTSLLTGINTNLDTISGQIDLLNDNVNVLNENIKFGIGLEFVIIVFVLIKVAYHIVGGILGLNKV